ncbi:MAG: FAD-dependent oxidoreductase [Lachnospiraceae bacterium]|nr:FAD-dependent oxidoreductase [Lachnospiraceae bacterium]
MSVTIKIDDRTLQVEEGMNVLEAALQNGIYIPHLCHHPDLPELGSCRLCIVEVEGEDGVTPSCKLEAKDGMVIRTKSDQISHLRNLSMELILAAHPEDCSTCPKYGQCEMQTLIQYMNVSATRMNRRVKGFKMNEENPLIIHDMNRCVMCGRCVRACGELRGVGVLQYNKKELETYVGTLHDKLLKDADCRFCGACAEVCPTGTIRDAMNYTPIEKRDTLIPCQATCPVHTDIPRYIRYVRQGKYAEATAVIHEKLPFPECLGRVCTRACEGKCRRGEVNEPVSIRNIKRYTAEHTDNSLWMNKIKKLPATGKKVCVIGGGPAGMTAAYYLGKQGHSVTLKEQYPALGGQMHYGIPSYRLPRDVVEKEAGFLSLADVKVETGVRVDHPAELLSEFDAVLVAVGTHKGVILPIPGSDLDGILVNATFLRQASMGEETGMGKKVVILGGGNVAFDCARSAVRLGAEEVHLACLEKREVMLADDEEIEQATEEGVHVHPGQTFDQILDDGNGHVCGVQFSNVEKFYFDENRRAVTVKEENSEHVIECDTVIFAVGQRIDLAEDSGLERGRGNSIATPTEGSLATSVPGIFAAGDAVYGTQTVIKAVASGRDAAIEIDKYLGGDGDITETLAPADTADQWIGHIDGFGYLERSEEEFIAAEERDHDFRPISTGICDAEICGESRRCLQCDLRFGITGHRLWSDYSNDAKEEAAI